MQFIVNEFKGIRNKYKKQFTIDSHSSQLEQELTNIYGYCNEVNEHCKRFNLPIDPDLNLLMNQVYTKKGVLYSNNPVFIADEKIPLFQNINKMEFDGVKYDRNSGKSVYFKLYNGYEEKIKKHSKHQTTSRIANTEMN